ncbi:MAG: hypothetical protein M3Y73_10535, partial [Actinomycetota bacterium]|nr:hypothetical protein [Actinomycetota bacterium]
MDNDSQIYHHAAEALAQMEVPTFEGLDPAEVTRAFDAVFEADDFLDPDPRWLDDFAREVGVISAGRVA